LKVCVIDEDRATYAYVSKDFAQVEWFRDVESFLRQLERSAEPVAVVADVQQPDMDGVELVQRLRDLGHTWPVILICEDADVATAVRAIRHGADDFLEKRRLGSLLAVSLRRLLQSDRAAH
jgi:FixJ family two-component response regulator